MVDGEILIRALEPDDIAAIADVFNQPRAIWGTLQIPYMSVEARRKRREMSPHWQTQLVAALGGRVIATAGLHPEENRRRAHAASIGMAVHDDFAGRGIGGALLSALLNQADNWLNLHRIELTVWWDNDRAIALYERFGFQREGLLRAYAWRDGAYADALAMARLHGAESSLTSSGR